MPVEDIAVIGLGCLFPGAANVGAFWRNILAKVDAITDPPHEAWDPALYYDVECGDNDRVYCKRGGYLGPLALFDPLEHGIVPRAVEGGEPDQWLALHVARAALHDAGYADAAAYRERAALILGKGTYPNRGTLSVVQHSLIVDYTLELLKSIQPELADDDLARIRRDLKQRLPRFDAETAPALIPNVSAGRIANRLDIMGPSYTVDAACASSLVAMDIAVKGLRVGEYDLALVGGMQVATPVPVLSLFCQLNALSRSERIRPFDRDADGTLLSEGIGMAVLKRRGQAERDGDRIYAFVKGTGVASDGRAVGVLAPRVEGEELALRRAYYAAAGVAPSSVGLVEAHGTGTLVGDAVEVEALTRVFGERTGAPHCALGSVKSMIGHTMPAAGMAGFIKAVLALHDKVLPPTLNVTEPSPRLGLDRTPFYINTEARPWVHGDPAQPRRAGVNAFGFGGINAHVLVEEAPAATGAATFDTAWDSEVCLFSGDSRDAVIALGRRVAAVIAQDRPPALAAVACSLNTQGRAPDAAITLAIVARSIDDLTQKLERALTRLADPTCRKIKDAAGIYFFDEPLARSGKLAFVFPGEGAQYLEMLCDLCRHFPAVRACFDAMDRVLYGHPRGYRLSDLVFPPPAFSAAQRQEAERRLWQMDVAVEAVVTANHALYTLLRSLGVTPAAVLGHSCGEYSAMRAAGMVDEDHHGERIVELNARHARAAGGGDLPVEARLIAIGAARERVDSLCASLGVTVSVAMDNCRHQVVVVAEGKAADALQLRLQEEGLLYERLSFDRPYHTQQFEPFALALRPILERWMIRPPVLPLYSCTSTSLYPSSLQEAHQLAIDHWIKPIEFRQTIESLWRDGFRIFVESGPRGNLTAFIDNILAGRPFAAIAANVSRRSGLLQLHHLIGQLAAHGIALNLGPLYERRALAAMDWAADAKSRAPQRKLGEVKIPTGVPDMRLSAESIALVRRRASASVPPAAAAAAVPVVADPLPPVHIVREPPSTQQQPATRAEGQLLDVVASPPRSGAPQVMSAFFQTMERFLAIEQALMDETFGGGGVAAPASPSFPLIHNVSGGAGRPLVARCTLDHDHQPFLRHHTLGRDVSAADPGLTGFPIVPFTAFMEIMAEAATALAGDRKVIGMREVRVQRWLATDKGPLHLEITADWIDAAQVAVAVREGGAADAALVGEGVMLLGDGYPVPPPPATALDLRHERTYTWPPERLYDEVMFHGPLFRGVCSINRVGDNGAEASLAVGERKQLLACGGDGLVTDFALLDQPGQVVGFWTSQFLARGFVVLPFRMGALHLYGPPLATTEQLTCRARIELVGERQVKSDLDVLRSDGRLWARFEDWDDRRFDLPDEAYRALLHPASAQLARRWTIIEDGAEASPIAAFRIGFDTFPAGWLHAHGGMWSRVLAALTLGRRERAIWHGSKAPERRRLEWLLGRIAAKDAVRDYLRRRVQLDVAPADVEILPDAGGRPVVTGAWTSLVPCVPLVSISHVDGSAVAAVSAGDGVAGIGIDLERCGRMKPEMNEVAFSAPERETLQAFAGDERQNWALRLWCAKEACAKATGIGPTAGLHALSVRAMDDDRGAVSIRCDTPDGPVDLVALTARDGDWIVATCAATWRVPVHEAIT